MNFPQFLTALFDQGRVAAPILGADGKFEALSASEHRDARRILADIEAVARSEFAGVAPAFSVDAALWSALNMYRACQAVLSRDIPAAELERVLGDARAPLATPEHIYSVDLAFRFLPDLYRLAKSASPDDPLTLQILAWCVAWPYSSVGVGAGDMPIDLEPLIAHADLLRNYVDRVIAVGDLQRLRDLRVAKIARGALGAFDNLAPKVAAAIASVKLA